MSTSDVHPSVICTNTKPTKQTEPDSDEYANNPTLPPQRHAGAVGLGPNYPLGASLGDKAEGAAEEIKGRILGKPEVVALGRERRTGELQRKQREREDAANPFKVSDEGGQ